MTLIICLSWAFTSLSNVRELEESDLPELLKKSTHSGLAASKAKESLSQFQSESFSNQYDPLGFIDGSYESHTGNWNQINPNGKPSPLINTTVGVRKKLAYGAQIEGSFNQYKNMVNILGNRSSIYGFIPQISVSLNLWKNLAGSFDQNQKAQLETQIKIANLESQVRKSLLLNQARILFWEIAGVDKRMSIVKKMQEASHTQERLAKQRQAMSIADAGELALYSSQSAERHARLLNLEYQRSALVEALSQVIPSLEGKEIVIASGKVDAVSEQVFACTKIIKSHPKAPIKFSIYEGLIKLLEEKLTFDQQLNKSYLQGDLSLTGVYSRTGSEGQYADAVSDSWDSNRNTSKLFLNFSYPLGERQKAYDYKQAADMLGFQSQKSDWELRLAAKHQHMLKSVDYLLQAVQAQKMNAQYLRTSLKSVEKKYAQARLDVYQLIGEQERSLSNDLAMIDTQLQIVKAVLEYLSLFSEFPCKFNQL